MNTRKVEEARAAYLATIETWNRELKRFKRGEISQAKLDEADGAVELATEAYSAALRGDTQRAFSFASTGQAGKTA